MEIQLTTGTALTVVFNGTKYDLKKPNLKSLKMIEAEKKKGTEGDMIQVMETVLVNAGMPLEIFEQLDIEQFSQIMEGMMKMLDSKKNLPA